jgi:hypothetical protein
VAGQIVPEHLNWHSKWSNVPKNGLIEAASDPAAADHSRDEAAADISLDDEVAAGYCHDDKVAAGFSQDHEADGTSEDHDAAAAGISPDHDAAGAGISPDHDATAAGISQDHDAAGAGISPDHDATAAGISQDHDTPPDSAMGQSSSPDYSEDHVDCRHKVPSLELSPPALGDDLRTVIGPPGEVTSGLWAADGQCLSTGGQHSQVMTFIDCKFYA